MSHKTIYIPLLKSKGYAIIFIVEESHPTKLYFIFLSRDFEVFVTYEIHKEYMRSVYFGALVVVILSLMSCIWFVFIFHDIKRILYKVTLY